MNRQKRLQLLAKQLIMLNQKELETTNKLQEVSQWINSEDAGQKAS